MLPPSSEANGALCSTPYFGDAGGAGRRTAAAGRLAANAAAPAVGGEVVDAGSASTCDDNHAGDSDPLSYGSGFDVAVAASTCGGDQEADASVHVAVGVVGDDSVLAWRQSLDAQGGQRVPDGVPVTGNAGSANFRPGRRNGALRAPGER